MLALSLVIMISSLINFIRNLWCDNMNERLCGFFQNLQMQMGKNLKLSINNNRSTMLSVKWEPHQTKVSIHKMFLDAPDSIKTALALYLTRQHKVISPSIKAYIEGNLAHVNHSHLVKEQKLDLQGKHFQLQKIYDTLNTCYFNNELQLRITWFGHPIARSRRRLSLGLYYNFLKLIKIHRLLDDPIIPEYVIEYVIYHEMLHAVCPPYIDERGFNRAHGSNFKRRESQFIHYGKAKAWLKAHQKNFFLFQRNVKNGWSQQMGKY